MKKTFKYFTIIEWIILILSITLILTSFFIFDRVNFYQPLLSILGVIGIIISAKGNPIGQLLMVIFSIFYGIISIFTRYYGESITYLLMTLPMAVISLISWLKNPFKKNSKVVKVNNIKTPEAFMMFGLCIIVTIIFYFILNALNTSELIVSTISISTSFCGAYLTFRRSPYFSLAYVFNDIVLIVLWSLACIKDITYLGIVICFIVFFINDIYCFIAWLILERKQNHQTNV